MNEHMSEAIQNCSEPLNLFLGLFNDYVTSLPQLLRDGLWQQEESEQEMLLRKKELESFILNLLPILDQLDSAMNAVSQITQHYPFTEDGDHCDLILKAYIDFRKKIHQFLGICNPYLFEEHPSLDLYEIRSHAIQLIREIENLKKHLFVNFPL